MDLVERIDALTDYDAVQVLNRAVSGVAAADPQIAKLQYLSEIWKQIASQTTTELAPRKDEQLGELPQQAEAARLVLREWAADAELASRVEAAIRADRKVLVEPITTALVMAGIIIALQTRVGLKVKSKDGKMDVQLEVQKKPTADNIIKKFFSFFG
jgi:hypothetical protein